MASDRQHVNMLPSVHTKGVHTKGVHGKGVVRMSAVPAGINSCCNIDAA